MGSQHKKHVKQEKEQEHLSHQNYLIRLLHNVFEVTHPPEGKYNHHPEG